MKSSSKRIGQLYLVLLDYHGNIIDGERRYGVDEDWRTMRLEHIRTEKDRLIARIISNTVRRTVPPREKTMLLAKLGEILLNEGVGPRRIAYKMSDETGMSYQWVMKHLPERFKNPPQSERAKSALRCRAGEDPSVRKLLKELLTPPQRKGALEIKKYANTHFVNVVVEKPFYEEFEKTSSKLGVPTEISMLKALEDYHEKMKKALALKKLEEKASKQNEKRQNSA